MAGSVPAGLQPAPGPDVRVGAAGSWLVGTRSLPWVTNAALGGTWMEPCLAATESKKLPNRLLLPAGPKGVEFGGFLEMKLSEILAPNVRTVGQAGRGVGPRPRPGVCSFAEGATSGHVSEAWEHSSRDSFWLELICRK